MSTSDTADTSVRSALVVAPDGSAVLDAWPAGAQSCADALNAIAAAVSRLVASRF